MNARERVLKAFNHEEPDRVPTFVQSWMPDFEDRLIQLYGDEFMKDKNHSFYGKNYNVPMKLGFDSSWGGGVPTLPPKDVMEEYPLPKMEEPNVYVDIFGRIQKREHLGWSFPWYVSNYLETEEMADEWYERYFSVEWEEYPNYVEQTNKKLEVFDTGRILPTHGVNSILEPIWESLGMGLFAKLLRKKKDKIKKYVGWLEKRAVKAAKIAVETNFEVFHLADDTAFKNRTMVKPELHRELIIPAYKSICQVIRKAGKFVFFHSDGFTTPYFDGLVEAGFHGVESLEPAAGNELKFLKEKYGDKLCLIGNIDVSRLLPYGSTEDVVEAVKNCIQDAAEGGGYILSPCTDLTDSCKLENVQTMISATKKYGQYPIKL